MDDMVGSNDVLYHPGEKPDHVVVIKYVPAVGDSKRAMDEYISEICMGGHNTIVVHNTCEVCASPTHTRGSEYLVLSTLCVIGKGEGLLDLLLSPFWFCC